MPAWSAGSATTRRLSRGGETAGKQPSIWAVMAASDGDLGALAADPRWRRPRMRPDSRAWTDDYSDLVNYLRLMPGGRKTD